MRFVALGLGFALLACEQPKETIAVEPVAKTAAIQVVTREGSGEPRAELAARVVHDSGGWVYQLDATAPPPWVVKSQTPFNLTLRPSAGVSLRRNAYDRRDFVDPDAAVKRIQAELEAGPGEHAIDAEVELYVCSAELCKRVNETLRTAFTIPKS